MRIDRLLVKPVPVAVKMMPDAEMEPPYDEMCIRDRLLGHIMIGAEMVGERIRTIEGFPVRMANELKHCILAHHGELEYEMCIRDSLLVCYLNSAIVTPASPSPYSPR